MLINPGDLIPVLPAAKHIPWNRRKGQVINFLHRGPVTFDTYVYDTNVGDITRLATYFNPDKMSIRDLNDKFAMGDDESRLAEMIDIEPKEQPPVRKSESAGSRQDTRAESVRPRLFVYPETSWEQNKVWERPPVWDHEAPAWDHQPIEGWNRPNDTGTSVWDRPSEAVWDQPTESASNWDKMVEDASVWDRRFKPTDVGAWDRTDSDWEKAFQSANVSAQWAKATETAKRQKTNWAEASWGSAMELR